MYDVRQVSQIDEKKYATIKQQITSNEQMKPDRTKKRICRNDMQCDDYNMR